MNTINVIDERPYSKNGLIILIENNNTINTVIFKHKKNADKYNRNNEEDVKKLWEIAKNADYLTPIDLNEATR
jgi:hypothetical protein